MRIVAISDTHTYGAHPRRMLWGGKPQPIEIPDGDVLVHAGDLTFRGTEDEVREELAWLASFPHKHKIVIAGNHDFFFDPMAPKGYLDWKLEPVLTVTQMMALFPSLHYLCDEEVTIEGLKFFGSPWVPAYGGWAFQLHDTAHAVRARNRIPDDVEVLVTHAPPFGMRDVDYYDNQSIHLGCEELAHDIKNRFSKLQLHIFGHAHAGYGVTEDVTPGCQATKFVNAAINTREYDPTNKAIVIDL